MSSLPLEGLKVLDLTRLLPGGFCSLLLADFGAGVIKVEDPGLGDYVRWAPPFYEGVEPSARSALFLSLNRGKRSIRVDLKTEAGKDVLLRLARDADVLLESFRPGVLDRLGVGYDRLREENPRLVYCAITGYGQDGPGRDRSGHDLNYLGLNGILGLSGEADGPPVSSAAQIADLGGGALMAAVGILTALRERDRSGQGQLVDCSMFDGSLRSWPCSPASSWPAADAAPGRAAAGGRDRVLPAVPVRRRLRHPRGARAQVLEHVLPGRGARGSGRARVDPPGSEAHRALEAIFAARTREEWLAFAAEHDCCLEPVMDLDEALDSELVAAREMVVDLEQPGAERAVRLLGVPIKLSRTPGDPGRAPGPGLGEHTAAVLAEAGFSEAEIEALLASGAVAGLADAGEALFMA